MWKDSIRNIVVIFQPNILIIVGLYVRHSAIDTYFQISLIYAFIGCSQSVPNLIGSVKLYKTNRLNLCLRDIITGGTTCKRWHYKKWPLIPVVLFAGQVPPSLVSLPHTLCYFSWYMLSLLSIQSFFQGGWFQFGFNRVCTYLLTLSFKLFFHPAKFDDSKTEKISDQNCLICTKQTLAGLKTVGLVEL